MPKLSPARKRPGAYHHGDLERALFAAALETIREDGVEALTLRRVGARLGVSRTALYRHFDDKVALLAAVAAEGFRLLHARLTRAVSKAAAPAEVLEEMGVAYVRFGLENQAHYQTMFGGYIRDWSAYPDLTLHAEATFSLLADTIAAGQRQGWIAAAEPIEFAEMVWSLTHGIVMLAAADQLDHSGRHRLPEMLVTLACSFLGGRRDTRVARRRRRARTRTARRRTR